MVPEKSRAAAWRAGAAAAKGTPATAARSHAAPAEAEAQAVAGKCHSGPQREAPAGTGPASGRTSADPDSAPTAQSQQLPRLAASVLLAERAWNGGASSGPGEPQPTGASLLDPASQRLARTRQRAAELLARRLRGGLCSKPARITGQAETATEPSAGSEHEAPQGAREAGPREAKAVGTAAPQLPHPPLGAASGPVEPLSTAEAVAGAVELTGPAASAAAAAGSAAPDRVAAEPAEATVLAALAESLPRDSGAASYAAALAASLRDSAPKLCALIAAAFPAAITTVSPLARLSRSIAGYLAGSPHPKMGPHTARVSHIGSHLHCAKAQGVLGADVEVPKPLKPFLQSLRFVRLMPEAGSSSGDDPVSLLPDRLRRVAAAAAGAAAAAAAMAAVGPEDVAVGLAARAHCPGAPPPHAQPQAITAGAPSPTAPHLPYVPYMPYQIPCMPVQQGHTWLDPAQSLHRGPLPGTNGAYGPGSDAVASSHGRAGESGSHVDAAGGCAEDPDASTVVAPAAAASCSAPAPSKVDGATSGSAAGSGPAAADAGLSPLLQLGALLNQRFVRALTPSATLMEIAADVRAALCCMALLLVEAPPPHRLGISVLKESLERRWPGLPVPKTLGLLVVESEAARRTFALTVKNDGGTAVRLVCPELLRLAALMGGLASAAGGIRGPASAEPTAAAASAAAASAPAPAGALPTRAAPALSVPLPDATVSSAASALAVAAAAAPPVRAGSRAQLEPAAGVGQASRATSLPLATGGGTAPSPTAAAGEAPQPTAYAAAAAAPAPAAAAPAAAAPTAAPSGLAGPAAAAAAARTPAPAAAVSTASKAARSTRAAAAWSAGPSPASTQPAASASAPGGSTRAPSPAVVEADTAAPSQPPPPSTTLVSAVAGAAATRKGPARSAPVTVAASSAAAAAAPPLRGGSGAQQGPAAGAGPAAQAASLSLAALPSVPQAALDLPSLVAAAFPATDPSPPTQLYRAIATYLLGRPRLSRRSELLSDVVSHMLATHRRLWSECARPRAKKFVEAAGCFTGGPLPDCTKTSMYVRLDVAALQQLPAARDKPGAMGWEWWRRGHQRMTQLTEAARKKQVAGEGPGQRLGGAVQERPADTSAGRSGQAAAGRGTVGSWPPTQNPGAYMPPGRRVPATAAPAARAGASAGLPAPVDPAAAAAGGAAVRPEAAAAGGLDKTHGQRLCRAAALLSADGESAAGLRHAQAGSMAAGLGTVAVGAAEGLQAAGGRVTPASVLAGSAAVTRGTGWPAKLRAARGLSSPGPGPGRAAGAPGAGHAPFLRSWGGVGGSAAWAAEAAASGEAAAAQQGSQPGPASLPEPPPEQQEPVLVAAPDPAPLAPPPLPPSRKELWAVLNARFEPVGAVGPKAAPEVVEAAAKRWMAVLLAEAPSPHELSVTDLEPLRLSRGPTTQRSRKMGLSITPYYVKASGRLLGRGRAYGADGTRNWPNRLDSANYYMRSNDSGRIGSNTKAFTAVTVAMLIEAKMQYAPGKPLTLSTQLKDIFPGWAMTFAYRSATVKNVFNMQAGFPSEFSVDVSAGANVRAQREIWVRALLQSTPINAVGNGSAIYSNANYIVLGHIVDRVTNNYWETIVRNWIFVPLKLGSAAIGPIGVDGQNKGPYGHRQKAGGVNDYTTDFGQTTPWKAPAGDIHMTAYDHAKWAAWNVAGRTPGFAPAACSLPWTPPCLSASLFAVLHERGHPTASFYGAGWSRNAPGWAGTNATTHNGALNGWYSEAYTMPATGLGLSVITNHFRRNPVDASDTRYPSDYVQDVAKAVLGKYRLPACGAVPTFPAWQSSQHGACKHVTTIGLRRRCVARGGARSVRPINNLIAYTDWTKCAGACVADSLCLAWSYKNLTYADPVLGYADPSLGCWHVRRIINAGGDLSGGRRLLGAAGGGRSLLQYNSLYNCSFNAQYMGQEVRRLTASVSYNRGFGGAVPVNNANNGAPCVPSVLQCADLCLKQQTGVVACKGFTYNASTQKCFLFNDSNITLSVQAVEPHCALQSAKIVTCPAT
ncbi:hypothetical protein HYH03_011400 [Edaphochlamys debaryana]|uniref:Apple domain-containing protein n=1 Tax=Edaphochlamys debaryana TaxID=47281 RepID=A0A835XUN2_9CHLO|nr:hypothetical protein HYH03_011400 [Edaphochlamys debaryana]|eukprot:KAG2490094.1 hypothetical protein HYH03_011400 [Edaphochlamys debaryana]